MCLFMRVDFIHCCSKKTKPGGTAVGREIGSMCLHSPPSKPALFAPDYDGDGVSSWWEWGIDGMLYAADFAFGGPTGESLVAKGVLTGITKGVGKTATKTAVKKGGIKVSFKAVDAKLLSKHGIKNIHTFKAEYLGNVDGSLFDVVKATSSGELLIIRKSTQQIE